MEDQTLELSDQNHEFSYARSFNVGILCDKKPKKCHKYIYLFTVARVVGRGGRLRMYFGSKSVTIHK